MGIEFSERLKRIYDILKAVAKKFEFEYPNNKMIKLSKEVLEQAENFKKYSD